MVETNKMVELWVSKQPDHLHVDVALVRLI